MLRIIYALSLFIMLTFIQMPMAHLAPANQTPRFVDLQNNDLSIAQFDTKTIKYEKDPYRDELLINVWIKASPSERTLSYSLSNYVFRINKREIMQLDQVDFNGNGQITKKTKHVYDPNSWSPVIPETSADKWYIAIMEYVKKNEKKLKSDYSRTKDGSPKEDSNGFFSSILDFLSM